ncbi:septum formation initiator [Microbispora sp. NEAU-D428]|uniref:septum formation initiator n=1 Tax=Microbispora sitophila TaxID=2771537 RepID=UPI001866A631|nr:septum formation initiator [Microbispora sitophila]MBE3011265.1 septum formation initiator [Microbispora sitophila]
MNSRLVFAVAGWLLAAALATGTGVAVLGLLGRPLTGQAERPMTAEEIRLALARDTPGPPFPASTPAGATPAGSSGGETPDAATGRRLVSTGAGSLIARCDGGLVRLQSWTPAQGFEVDDVDPGPDDRARVKFESDEGRLEIEVRCAGGVPVPRVTRHDD